MDTYKVNQKEIFFILNEQLNYGKLCELEPYRDFNQKTLDLMVKEANNFARGVLAPLNEIGEKEGIKYENGKVICPAEYKSALKKFGEDGWISASSDTKYGGGGFPIIMRIIASDVMIGASMAFVMAPSLTRGAAHLIESFGADTMKDTYVSKMYNGTWTGTMCLTEPEAGSNLGALQTAAYRDGDHYRIKGTKIFISWGDHDLTDNIIHLVLARIEGAPDGVKGISLFAVPKVRVNSDGSLGESNDVNCGGIENKLGLHGGATATLVFGEKDDCQGYLVGQENMGLANMFQMMNGARIGTGISALSNASCAYQAALSYTKTRIRQDR